MTRPIIKIHNIETDEIIERELNDDEFAVYEADLAKAEADKAKAEAKATAKAELLAKLGISQDEANLLLS